MSKSEGNFVTIRELLEPTSWAKSHGISEIRSKLGEAQS